MTTTNRKHIVLTGASRGLGLAMAAGFVESGHTVIGCSRQEEAVAALRDRWPAPHRFDVVNVADDVRVADWAGEVLQSHGPPELLINNAAVINSNAKLWGISAEEFDPLIDINVKGVANVIRHFVPAMIRRGSGVIVNVSSGWGRSVAAEVAPYCASKWAIEGLTRALAEELPDGMAAVPLNPGVIHTEMLDSCFGAAAANFPEPGSWAESAVPFLLGLSAADNGHPLTVP